MVEKVNISYIIIGQTTVKVYNPSLDA